MRTSVKPLKSPVITCINLISMVLQLPGPQRGEIVRQIGHALREKKDALGNLVSIATTFVLFIFDDVNNGRYLIFWVVDKDVAGIHHDAHIN